MKNLLIKSLFILFAVNISFAQKWMTDIDIAQKLALVQNKMVLMVWKGTTEYPYPVFVNDDKGRTIFIDDLFTDEEVSPLIWEHFVPVIVNENKYGLMYYDIKGKRSQRYIDKFNDNSIKIMDVNGNIINVTNTYSEDLQNITEIIKNYSISTAFVTPELQGYNNEKTFYSAYYLASKYMDFSMYLNENLRPELMTLLTIYINEAKLNTKKVSKEDQLILQQRCDLLEIQQYLLLKRPKKVLRQLKKINAEEIENKNKPFVAFLYYTAYSILENEKNAKKWKAEVSSVNLKKAQLIINLNS
ncbi:hypothetical protein FBALC1_04877 [Flavobacteriales bacterium ALC-1]|nr:hypothetical protein FBALC1_04877 [Flavobacteriales bacterium ALC-1]